MSDEEIKEFKVVNNWDVARDPYFDRMSWIDLQFNNMKATSLEIGRTESY
jgi:hypothetical protein